MEPKRKTTLLPTICSNCGHMLTVNYTPVRQIGFDYTVEYVPMFIECTFCHEPVKINDTKPLSVQKRCNKPKEEYSIDLVDALEIR